MPRSQLPPSGKTEFYKRIRIKKTADCSVGTLGTENNGKLISILKNIFNVE